MTLPRTLGELRKSAFSEQRLRNRKVKDELRDNLINKLRSGETIFPGIIGYDDTVVPQLVNAVLSRHNFILLGLRGQAKSRILRALTALLDPQLPCVAGCEIHDNPYDPICRRCRDLIAEQGDSTPIAYLAPDERYVEKLATPDVTIADLIGDVDPIKAARGGHDLSSQLTVHYGLLPRANRGIFAINELPDLAGKIQVGLFNIMQEGDVQIKGYPLRLPLDVALVFTREEGNALDYFADVFRHMQFQAIAARPGFLFRDADTFFQRAGIVRANLCADAVFQRGDDFSSRGVILGIGGEDEEHVEREA